MFNQQKLSHQQPNDQKLTDLVEERFEELRDEESAKIQGGFFYSPYQALNSYYWYSTQAVLANNRSMQGVFDRHNENVLKSLRDG